MYVGADAATAPAASLRALHGVGAVFVPDGLPEDLRRLVVDAIAGQTGAVTPPGPLAGDSAAAAKHGIGRPSAAAGRPAAGHGAGLAQADPRGETMLTEVASTNLAAVLTSAHPLVVIAGPQGPALARALAAELAAAGRAADYVPAQPLFDDCLIAQELISLQRVTRILREQCPWDRVQTSGDIVSYSLEEVYELADAIAEGDVSEEHGELGDVLFQVYFLSLLLQEQEAGDLGTVAADIERKLIRRHEHIFGNAVAETPAAVRGQWERIKREQEGRQGIFHDVPGALPALLHARKLQRRAAEVGFDWDTAHEAFGKIAEEHAELAEALAAHRPRGEFDDTEAAPAEGAVGAEAASREGPLGRPEGSPPGRPGGGSIVPDVPEGAEPEQAGERGRRIELRHDPAVRHEFGDLLFAVVNVARKAGVDPELALREASQRFERRVCGAERLAAAEQRDWSTLALAEQESYYQRAKAMEWHDQKEPQS